MARATPYVGLDVANAVKGGVGAGITIIMSAVPGGTSDDDRLVDVRRRAQKRWWYVLAAIAVVSGVGGAFGGQIFGGERRGQHAGHHPVVAIIGLVVVALIAIAALVWLVRKVGRSTGMFAPPLTAGLPRTDRRQVVRAIRRVRRSSDPTLRAVEHETAERIVRQGRVTMAMFGAALVLELLNAVFVHHSLAGTIFYYALAGLFVAALVEQVYLRSRARRYLTAAGSELQG